MDDNGSANRIPKHGEGDGQHGKERPDGGEEHTDLHEFFGGDQVGGQFLEYALKFIGAGGRIIFSTGFLGDLLKGNFIDASVETASTPAASSATKLVGKPIGAASHERRTVTHVARVIGAKPNGVHADATVDGKLSGIQRLGPELLLPSVSKTIMFGTKSPGERGVVGAAEPSAASGGTLGSNSAMA